MKEGESNLGPEAKEVYPVISKLYGELRKNLEERGEIYDEMTQQYGSLETVNEVMDQENVVKLANKIVKKLATPEEEIDFGLLLTEAKSRVTSSADLTEKQVNIINNYIRKLRASVRGESVEV